MTDRHSQMPQPAVPDSRLEELLLKTSRTFALSIPLLPEPTRGEVGVAYLLFRIADTLEDATRWPAERQIAQLEVFGRLLGGGSAADPRRLTRDWEADPPLDHAGYRELLAELPFVLDRLASLSPAAQRQIRHHTRRTAERMAAFVARSRGGGDVSLSGLPDLRDYCYAVAGIVGEMLTELFLLQRPALAGVADELRGRAATFGEALQLVNILKDSADDVVEGRHYLAGAGRGEVFALAREDLRAAGAYVATLQRAGAPRGIVEFCALPVLLAWATLDRVERDGPGAKLTRFEVAEIVQGMHEALDRGDTALILGD